jgi:hypothetical protein
MAIPAAFGRAGIGFTRLAITRILRQRVNTRGVHVSKGARPVARDDRDVTARSDRRRVHREVARGRVGRLDVSTEAPECRVLEVKRLAMAPQRCWHGNELSRGALRV